VRWSGSGRMDTAEGGGRTWLLVAAERREFEGILKRFGKWSKIEWAAEFACEAEWKGDRWLMVANGPGPRLIESALKEKRDVSGMISTGFCGALDPGLRVGDIVLGRSGTCPTILSMDRVAVTADEKAELHRKTGAAAIEMEAAAVEQKAAEWDVPFYCVRAVSDTASEDMPLDFNRYRDVEGRFSRGRIALAAMARPFMTLPALLRLNRNCRIAADALGEFFVNHRF
jgi:adenosylhomocysteine nucleosidase